MTHTTVAERPPDDVTADVHWSRRDLVMGRPVEDRGFEVVEAGAGFAVGFALGAMVAGPIGAAVGGVAGAAGGFVVGEALVRKVGLAATTIDATEPEAD